MTSTTNPTSPPPHRCRRWSTRKRKIPVRYGFDDADQPEAKRQRTKMPSLCLMDLPVELLRHTVSFLSGMSDRFSLQTTNKLFQKLSNSPEIIQGMPLLLSSTTTPTTTTTTSCTFIPEDLTAKVATRRLLPFAKASNPDGLFLLGLLAMYVEDDTGTGLALLQKGMEQGDLRCQHEIGNFLKLTCRNETDAPAGRILLEQAAKAGHAPSQVALGINISYTRTGRGERRNVYQRARNELSTVNCCLQNLMSKKVEPPSPRWKGQVCGNPSCFRRYYSVQLKPVRRWLKYRRLREEYSHYWRRRRPQIKACGTPFPNYRQERRSLYFVPPFQICSQCRVMEYCSRTCQVLHWAEHKLVCVPPDVAAAAAAPPVGAAGDAGAGAGNDGQD